MPGSCASDSVTTFASCSGSATRIIATKSHSPVTDQASETPSISASWPPSVWSASRSARIRTTACVTRRRIRLSARPGTDPADALHADAQAHARRGVVHRREAHLWAEVHVREFLEQLRRATFLDRGGAVDDRVLPQPGRLDLAALERDNHARLTLDVLELLLRWVEMAGEQVVAVEADPHARDLRAAVLVGRHQVAQRAGPDQIFHSLVQHSADSMSARALCGALRPIARRRRISATAGRWSGDRPGPVR